MATLLHIDSSLNGENSASRSVTSTFRKEWEAQHPNGTVIYRDLAAEPLPHLDQTAAVAGFSPREAHTPEQAAAFALREKLAEELEAADTVLIGAPMYNFTIPSTLKAWLDHIILVGRTAGENPSLKGTPVTIVATRGGGYGEGTPRAAFEYAQSYLTAVFKELQTDVDVIVSELTLAKSVPAMAELVPLAEESRAKALADAESKAKALAERLAA
jgi:FMN-dependent NADH-azoreductase